MAQIFASERGSSTKSAASDASRRAEQKDARPIHAEASGTLASLQTYADASAPVRQLAKWTGKGTAQRQGSENKSGLPDDLRGGIEALSGYAMDDVKVHYNSDKPAGLNAHAYAQGTDIHLGPGQEKHLAHEAWHTVQQKQGRVQPTHQLKGAGVPINDNEGLEKEADSLGAKAMSYATQMMARSKDD